MTILVSACLIGVNCKYSGENNYCSEVVRYLADKSWVPICPEQLGGLPTPRTPAEIENGDGALVLSGICKVMTKDGQDVTVEFIKGAEETLQIANLCNATEAILKAKSPSCGEGQIYDGNFRGKLKTGSGVTASLLKEHGLVVKSELDF